MSTKLQVFTKEFSHLVTSVSFSLNTVADACFSEGLISGETYDAMSLDKVDSDKARRLLRNVYISIEMNPSAFDKFITILINVNGDSMSEDLKTTLRDSMKVDKQQEKKTNSSKTDQVAACLPIGVQLADDGILGTLQTPYASGVHVVDLCVQKLKLWIKEENRFIKRLAFVMTDFGKNMKIGESSGGIWQVSFVAFEDTKKFSSHGRLQRKYQRLAELYGIDWMLVSYSDLNKPLYSALAARLYLSNDPVSIPPYHAILEQAAYWRTYYMKGAGENAAYFYTKITELEN